MYARVLNSGKRHLLTMNPPFSQTTRHTQFGGPSVRRKKEIPANDTRIPIVYCVFSFGTNYDGFHGRIGAFSSKIASLFRLFSHTWICQVSDSVSRFIRRVSFRFPACFCWRFGSVELFVVDFFCWSNRLASWLCEHFNLIIILNLCLHVRY